MGDYDNNITSDDDGEYADDRKLLPLNQKSNHKGRNNLGSSIKRHRLPRLPSIRAIDITSSESDDDEAFGNNQLLKLTSYCTCKSYVLAAVYNRLADISCQQPKGFQPSNDQYLNQFQSYQNQHNQSSQGHHIINLSYVNTIVKDLLHGRHLTLRYFGNDVLNLKITGTNNSGGNNSGTNNSESKMLFVFDDGCCCFFNFTPAEEHGIIALLQPFEVGVLSPQEREAAVEDLVYTTGPFSLHNDVVTLPNKNLAFLSCAFALSRGCQLNVWEYRAEMSGSGSNKEVNIDITKHIDQDDLWQQIDKLYRERNRILEAMDAPDLFWNSKNSQYEQIYIEMRRDLEMTKRITLLNNKLLVLKEYYDVAVMQLNVKETSLLHFQTRKILIILTTIVVLIFCTYIFTLFYR